MTTKKTKKAKADDEQEPLSDFQKAVDGEELDDPSLYPEMDTVRIPKLESVGKRFLAQKDLVKHETEKRDGLDEECQIIMADHQIEVYRTKTLSLRLKRGKTHVDGELN